jgi:ribosomal protein S18 acetylase RimI-like enzyme
LTEANLEEFPLDFYDFCANEQPNFVRTATQYQKGKEVAVGSLIALQSDDLGFIIMFNIDSAHRGYGLGKKLLQ